jgi:pyruvate/2-oxoglutarate dehydrogenase complex dihydrolipoamide acyltransferase (E2) component
MNVLMPQLGETVSEGTIAVWHKKEGDAVAKGDMLIDVETDKVATEITAPESGVLTSISVPEGETVDVGTILAVIAVEGEESVGGSSGPVAAKAAPTVIRG